MTKPLALSGIDTGRPQIGPSTVHIDITNACNTNCITCWDHSPLLTIGRSTAWKRQRVDVEHVRELLDDVMSLGGLRAVIVSGMGDPFVHPDIYAIIEAVKSRGLHLTIITNLIPADPERIIDLDVDQLLIGIHAASETAYQAFHPNFRRDEWTRLHDALEQFRRAGRRYKHVHVICEPNVHELPAMVEQAADYAAERVNFKLASLRNGTEAARITDDQRARLVAEWLPRARAVAERRGVATNLDVFAAQVAAGGAATAPIEDVGCFMGFVYSRITVDGTVLYCCNTEVVIGKLGNGVKFSDLWTGATWNSWRDRMRAGDYLPSCSQCGKVNQNVKIRNQFAKTYGAARLAEVTGAT